MNRKIIVLLILIGLFAIIGISAYAYMSGALDAIENQGSEVSEVKSSELTSEALKDPSEGVDTEVPVTSETEAESDGQSNNNTESEYDENGDLRSESKYLDDDEDTIANYFDICPGVDDFSSECETDAYGTNDDSVADDNTLSETADQTESEYDENGDLKSESKYLDADGDTIANYYDICPGVDDFSSECETDAYN